MLRPLAILLSLAVVPHPALSAPRGGGGAALGALGAALVVHAVDTNTNNGYLSDVPPDSGYDATTDCDYKAGSAPTDAFATNPVWIANMTSCLDIMVGPYPVGTTCAPATGGVTFGFWKGHDDYDDAADCYSRCAPCLSKAINAGQAITTKCQYEYKTHRAVVGYKTHTCTMGYDKNT